MTKIAIVEDNRVIRESLMEFVKADSECECVYVCATAEKALKEIPKHQPDIVLMDIQLPDISGIECTAQLKQLMPSVQIIMVTVYEDANHIFNALSAGASGYLLKQTRRTELLDALKDVHAGGSPMSSQIARKVVQNFHRNETQMDGETVQLSGREREVLELLARGYLYKEIAEQLKISVQTVNTYIRRIYEKLHVRSRAQAVAKYAHLPMGATH